MASAELLQQIQAGKKLKKAETNDRSAPAIDPKPSGGRGGIGVAPTARAAGVPAAPSSVSASGPPQLGGLFVGGIPKLKPAGQSNLGMRLDLSSSPRSFTLAYSKTSNAWETST